MKQTLGICILILISICGYAQYSGGGEAYPELKTNLEALKDFQDMRFGMFIHWGPVSLRGKEISWFNSRHTSC